MSATPIPRTLEMAITGIREMSVIATPPEERHPVLTFAGPYDSGQVRAAIRRELAREGQAFYIHNRVQTIDKTAQQLAELIPEARVAVAHGKMNEHTLEQVMVDFWERRFDVLVCTTIVEAGLDIATANTLLIERADLLGLSQLHQLRGRVGRSRERGYAYFLYPPEKPLTETAHDRLATMAAHTDLGAGMAIAMKDLEIRGAGNLLGGEQSGHIAEVGFDLYIRLVGEAVADFRGEDVEPEPEMKIELPVDAHLPNDYVESERLRLEMYKRLAAVTSHADLAAVRDELVDRYGEPPAPVEALLAVARFRIEDVYKRQKLNGLIDLVGTEPVVAEVISQCLSLIHISAHRAGGNDVTVLTAVVPDATGYGRIVRDGNEVARIVEHADATDAELDLTEINSGIYVFDAATLSEGLAALEAKNSQGELYLTDVLAHARASGRRVGAQIIADYLQTEGVNDRAQLADRSAELNRRILARWMADGVTVLDPASTWVHAGVDLAEDVTLLPGTSLEGATSVARGATIGPDTTLHDCEVGERCV